MAEKKAKPAEPKGAKRTAPGPQAASEGGFTPPQRAGGLGGAAQHPPDKRKPSPKVPVVNAANEPIREIQLSPDVFAADPNPHLVYEAVKQYRAGGRRGTHMTKNRALVSGSGKKPWLFSQDKRDSLPRSVGGVQGVRRSTPLKRGSPPRRYRW